MKIKFIYRVDKTFLEEEFISGSYNSKERSVEFDLVDLSAQARQDILTLSQMEIARKFYENRITIIGSLWNGLGGDTSPIGNIELVNLWLKNQPLELVQALKNFPKAQITLEDVEKALAEMVEQARTIIPEYNRLVSEAIQKKEDEKEKSNKEKNEILIQEEQQQKAFRLEMTRWIQEHGTEQLRLAHELGYTCNQLYATERATLEHPSFTLDLEDEAEWEDWSYPSLEALKLVKELLNQGKDARIVWLTHAPDDYEGYDCTPCEAVVISNFLGKYNLVQ